MSEEHNDAGANPSDLDSMDPLSLFNIATPPTAPAIPSEPMLPGTQSTAEMLQLDTNSITTITSTTNVSSSTTKASPPPTTTSFNPENNGEAVNIQAEQNTIITTETSSVNTVEDKQPQDADAKKAAAAIAATTAALTAVRYENPLLENNPYKRDELPIYFPGFYFNELLNYTDIFKPPPVKRPTVPFPDMPANNSYRKCPDESVGFVKYTPGSPVTVNYNECVNDDDEIEKMKMVKDDDDLPLEGEEEDEPATDKKGDTEPNLDEKETVRYTADDNATLMPVALLQWENDIMFDDSSDDSENDLDNSSNNNTNNNNSSINTTTSSNNNNNDNNNNTNTNTNTNNNSKTTNNKTTKKTTDKIEKTIDKSIYQRPVEVWGACVAPVEVVITTASNPEKSVFTPIGSPGAMSSDKKDMDDDLHFQDEVIVNNMNKQPTLNRKKSVNDPVDNDKDALHFDSDLSDAAVPKTTTDDDELSDFDEDKEEKARLAKEKLAPGTHSKTTSPSTLKASPSKSASSAGESDGDEDGENKKKKKKDKPLSAYMRKKMGIEKPPPPKKEEPEPEPEISEIPTVPLPPAKYNFGPIYKEIEETNWEDVICWDDDLSVLPTQLCLNLNDRYLLFEYGDGPPPIQPFIEQKKRRNSVTDRENLTVAKNDKWFTTLQSLENQATSDGLDIYNLSNDKIYDESGQLHRQSGTKKFTISHSVPALRLAEAYFSTYFTTSMLRHWHRQPLRKMNVGKEYSVVSLSKYIEKRSSQRESDQQASGGGELFFMRSRKDLSGKDGKLVLFECCEEFPSLVSNVGMGTKFINYYKKKGLEGRPKFDFGTLTIVNKNDKPQLYFLGDLNEGQWIQSMENHMYRAPVYKHAPKQTDFLIVRSKEKLFIREITTLFVVGQQIPKMEVPTPNNRVATSFVRTRLNVYILKLLMDKKNTNVIININDIKKGFPSQSELNIRKALKIMADMNRPDVNVWKLKPEYRLPNDEELREKLTPEEICCYESMLAAQQRLKDAGYGSHSLAASVDEDNNEDALKIDDEIKFAPWNTTKNILDMKQNKCLIKVTGIGDPTGCGEGYSYLRASNKPLKSNDKNNPQPKTRVTDDPGADLRKLHSENAKKILRDFGLPDQEINALERSAGGRWKLIGKVRELSSRTPGGSQYARQMKPSTAEHLRRYYEICNKVFHSQNQTLSSEKILESDSDSSGSDSDLDDFADDLEELMSVDNNDINTNNNKQKPKQEVLKITRTYQNQDGSTYKRLEVIKDPRVIKLYIDRSEKQKSETQAKREAALKRKKQIAENRPRKYRKKDGDSVDDEPAEKTKYKRSKEGVKCSACGEMGHMRSNKLACKMHPQYDPQAMAEEEELRIIRAQKKAAKAAKLERMARRREERQKRKAAAIAANALAVPGTSFDGSSDGGTSDGGLSDASFVKTAKKKGRKKGGKNKPKASPAGDDQPKTNTKRGKYKKRKIKKPVSDDDISDKEDPDFMPANPLSEPLPFARRESIPAHRRENPMVDFANHLEQAWQIMHDYPETWPFHQKVHLKDVPDYYDYVTKPMDLQKLAENMKSNHYYTREAFMLDVDQIVNNCMIYNGEDHPFSTTADEMRYECRRYFDENHDEIQNLEAKIERDLADMGNLIDV